MCWHPRCCLRWRCLACLVLGNLVGRSSFREGCHVVVGPKPFVAVQAAAGAAVAVGGNCCNTFRHLNYVFVSAKIVFYLYFGFFFFGFGFNQKKEGGNREARRLRVFETSLSFREKNGKSSNSG